jgi:hypothetical protein
MVCGVLLCAAGRAELMQYQPEATQGFVMSS